MEAAETLGVKPHILKLGTTHPLPRKLITDFVTKLDKVLVVEELLPYLEQRIKAIAKDATPDASEAGYRAILASGGFTFFDDRPLYLGMMERILAGCPTIRARSGFSAF